MVKRFCWKRYGYVAFAIIILVLSWETNKTNAALADAGIPQEAIRIRIVANSDTIQDQAVKRVIRDRIIEEVSGWVTEPQNIEAARQTIQDHLPEMNELVGTMLKDRGFEYPYEIEFGKVEFPEKMYGAKLYPANSYEALKITLGRGDGKNWWCVLFPPLCFADAVAKEKDKSSAAGTADAKGSKANGESAGKTATGAVKEKTSAGKSAKSTESGKTSATAASAKASAPSSGKAETVTDGSTNQASGTDVEIHFFVWDKTKAFFSWVKGLFA